VLRNEDLGQLDLELRESPEWALGRIIEKKWKEANYAVQRRCYVCCIDSETYKSVARIRLVKTEIPSVYATVN
jgi:hypothetical protein